MKNERRVFDAVIVGRESPKRQTLIFIGVIVCGKWRNTKIRITTFSRQKLTKNQRKSVFAFVRIRFVDCESAHKREVNDIRTTFNSTFFLFLSDEASASWCNNIVEFGYVRVSVRCSQIHGCAWKFISRCENSNWSPLGVVVVVAAAAAHRTFYCDGKFHRYVVQSIMTAATREMSARELRKCCDADSDAVAAQ